MKFFVILIAVTFLIALARARMELAAQDPNSALSDDNDLRHRFLRTARALGVTYIREMASISSLDPCLAGVASANTLRIIRLIKDAKTYGMRVQLVITGSATSYSEICMRKPGALIPIPEWKKFVTNVVKAFYPHGVRRFAIWNEPNHPAYNCAGKVTKSSDFVDDAKCHAKSSQNQKRYLKLYQSAWTTVRGMQKKGHVKKAKVWFGEFAGNALEWTSKLLKGRRLKTDGYSWHPYQYCAPPETTKKTFPVKTCRRATSGIGFTPKVQKMLKKWAKTKQLTTRSGKRVPMYMTEFGYHCQGKYKLPEAIRAKFYVRALEWARKNGARGFVLFQFYPTPPNSVWDTSLLLPAAQGYAPSLSYRKVHAWAKKRGYKVKAI